MRKFWTISLLRTAVAGMLLACYCGSASADLVSVEYYDPASPGFPVDGGPVWTGVVDTVTNNLRIDSWLELPGHGANFWVPANLPLVWTARDENGDVYDVPDTFGIDGTVTIDDNFAFISPIAAQDMSWVDIGGNPKTSSFLVPTRVGWGGFAEIVTLGGPYIFRTAAVGTEPAYDEATMPRLPIIEASMVASTGATVRVTGRVTNPNPVIIAVPEPSAFLSVALVAAVSTAGRWMRRKLG